VRSGRIAGAVSLLLAVICARPLLGGFEQAFQYIQEFTGFFTPGICAIFLLGVFVRQTTALGALAAALGSFLLSIAARIWLPELPFMDRVGYVFLACCALALGISALQGWKIQPKSQALPTGGFATSSGFNIGAALVTAALIAIYAGLG
jgi:SSS family solute:Na+ symporter